MLVNGVEVWLETSSDKFALSSERYEPSVVEPDGVNHIEIFESRPYLRRRIALARGTRVDYGVIVAPEHTATL